LVKSSAQGEREKDIASSVLCFFGTTMIAERPMNGSTQNKASAPQARAHGFASVESRKDTNSTLPASSQQASGRPKEPPRRNKPRSRSPNRGRVPKPPAALQGQAPPVRRGGKKDGSRNMAQHPRQLLMNLPKSHPIQGPTAGATTQLIVEPYVTVRVIKGEIHNVLSVMRTTDHRYLSPYRFTEEVPDEQHTVVLQLLDLQQALVEWDWQADSPPPLLYLPPFCAAVERRDVNAAVTGAALAALHKFLIYGFLHPSDLRAPAGMTRIAQALLHCTFEESTPSIGKALSSGNGRDVAAAAAAAMAAKNHSNKNKQLDSKTQERIGPAGLALTIRVPRSDSANSNSGAASSHYHHHRQDEQVVLKLLDLAALVVRCSFSEANTLLTSDLVVGLLDTCLHVSHIAQTASPLLKAAATDALSQIVLQVFAGSGTLVRKARQLILSKLASLLNPAVYSEQVIVSSLTAVNIALETCREEPSPAEISILQNDLCKYLLQWSTTHDLLILSLTLRVIFNLFQSIANHLKVPLEVFLTSVHLRMLETDVADPEEKEVALESVLEFCHEPALMQDIYLNYDCDVACTNLYERVVTILGKVAQPDDDGWSAAKFSPQQQQPAQAKTDHKDDPSTTSTLSTAASTVSKEEGGASSKAPALASVPEPEGLNHLNRLAMEGILAILNSIARRVQAAGNTKWEGPPSRSPPPTAPVSGDASAVLDDGAQAAIEASSQEEESKEKDDSNEDSEKDEEESKGDDSAVNVEGETTEVKSEDEDDAEVVAPEEGEAVEHVPTDENDKYSEGAHSTADKGETENATTQEESSAVVAPVESTESEEAPRSADPVPLSEEELHRNRLKKTALVKMAALFNDKPTKQEWLEFAVSEHILETVDDAKAVANLLYTAPHLDKAQVGIYLSKGPDSEYPFNVAVRKEFVARYDFKDLPFSAALRLFLSRFRLPGEAQCIDRFMESFSAELYRQQSGEATIFMDADAVYVLAFSTIMLNTDLHNPQIKDENRMTVEQFLRNNRGINGGEDLPETYLIDLYHQIKETQIQVQKEVNDFMNHHQGEDFWTSWDSILSRGRDVQSPFFTPAHLARGAPVKAGVHDKEMFTVVARHAIKCLPAILKRSWDDAIVVKALRGLRQMASIADYFGMDDIINDVVNALLAEGRDYVVSCITQEHARDGMGRQPSMRSVDSDDDGTEGQTSETGIPYSLLTTGKGHSEVSIAGAASHRGLLAIDSGFVLIRRYTKQIVSAWPMFIECLCALRDARALPAGLSDLDDFADSNGNVLPLSPYAKASQKRLDDFYRSKSTFDTKDKPEGWFSGLFRKKEEDPKLQQASRTSLARKPGYSQLSEECRALLAVAEATEVESIVQMGSTILPSAENTIRSLLEVVDEYPYEENPVKEQHAIFSLELAARALLSNREKAPELFPLFLQKFENILGKITERHIPSPFVIERIAVTILRCSIHLYENDEMRPTLRVSLQLIFTAIPAQFTKYVADRMACGLAIILRASYSCFQTHNEWAFVGDSLDMLAQFGLARVFVFDGIASTVEYALPQYGASGEVERSPDEHEDDDERATLSKEACAALSRILIRFALGFYRGDVTLAVPATVCLEKLYRHKNALLIKADAAKNNEPVPKNIRALVPDKEFWQNVAVAVYAVCRSPNPETSKHGYECCQRILLRTPPGQIADDKWIAILFLMVNKQPPTAADFSRANTFVLIGNLLMRTLPQLSKNASNIQDIKDLINQVAGLAEDNLRHGRRGTVSPLFEKTLQTVTYLSNHLQTDDWKGDKEFGVWASEILLAELEKVGAAGAALKNQAAVQKPEVSQPPPPESAPTKETKDESTAQSTEKAAEGTSSDDVAKDPESAPTD